MGDNLVLFKDEDAELTAVPLIDVNLFLFKEKDSHVVGEHLFLFKEKDS